MVQKYGYSRLAALTLLFFAQCGTPPLRGGSTGDGGAGVDFALSPDLGDSRDAATGDFAVPVDDRLAVLGSARSFAVLGGQTVTSTGGTRITGNLGVSPGIVVTGFPPGTVTAGTMNIGDTVAMKAQSDLTAAYNALRAAACAVNLSGQELSGLTLKPGVYCFSTSAAITRTTNLILDAQGDPNAVFIFQIGSTLTTGSNTAVQVINGGSNCNVYWQVGSSVTIGTSTIFAGNIIAFSSITLQTGATVSGRVLARNAAVSMDINSVSFATCAAVPPTADLSVMVTSGQPSVDPGSTFTYLVTVINRGPQSVQNVAVTTQLIASGGPAPTTGRWTCSATASANCGMPAGSGNIDTPVNLAVGGVVVFVVTVTVPAQGAGTLEYRAHVAPSTIAADPDLTNNSATYAVSISGSGTDMRGASELDGSSLEHSSLAGGGFSCNATGAGNSASAFCWVSIVVLAALSHRRKRRFLPTGPRP